MELKEWAIMYLKHRDLFEKKIESINDKGNKLLLKQKGGDCIVAVIDELSTDVLDADIIVTRNLQQNLDCLLADWKAFAEQNKLKVIFANADRNEKWIICPHQHARVAEEESLKLGLQAMFNEVTEG